MDRSLPGSSVHGIVQARVLEWGAIAFSDYTDKSIIYLDPELQETPELFTEVSFWPPEHRLFSMLWEETEKM